MNGKTVWILISSVFKKSYRILRSDIHSVLISWNTVGFVCLVCTCAMWASTPENLTLLHAINKSADQPALSRSLISAFVFGLYIPI